MVSHLRPIFSCHTYCTYVSRLKAHTTRFVLYHPMTNLRSNCTPTCWVGPRLFSADCHLLFQSPSLFLEATPHDHDRFSVVGQPGQPSRRQQQLPEQVRLGCRCEDGRTHQDDATRSRVVDELLDGVQHTSDECFTPVSRRNSCLPCHTTH
jgi:hypothetical protein